MDRPEKICVLILNYVTWEETLHFVENLQQQRDIDLSVLIVDNCSPNDSFGHLSRACRNMAGVEVIRSDRNGGYAFGNNLGLQHLAGRKLDFIAISNNDLRIENPYLLRQLSAEFRRLPAMTALLAPCMLVDGREDAKHQAWRLPRLRDEFFASLRSLYWLADRLGLTNRYRFGPMDSATYPVDCLSGSFFLCRPGLLESVGGFDEGTFLYGEETILAHRIRQAGKQSFLVRSLHYHHLQAGTTRRLHRLARLQRYRLDSAVYYHRHYRHSGWAGLFLIRLLFYPWLLETAIMNLLRFRS